MGEEEIKDYLKLLGKEARQNAADALVSIGDPALPYLLKAVKDKNEQPVIRLSIPWVLARIGNERAVLPLTNILQDKRETPIMREEIALALGDMRSKKAIGPLAKTLNDTSESQMLRRACAFAIGKIGGKEALNALKGQEKIEKDPLIKDTIEKSITLMKRISLLPERRKEPPKIPA